MIIRESPNTEPGLRVLIFGVVETSILDGPGQRTVLFFQGCNAGCMWCHSPHSQPDTPVLLFHEQNCCLCRRCAEACKNGVHTFPDGRHHLRLEYCSACGVCVRACPQSRTYRHGGALSIPAKSVVINSLMTQLEPYLDLCGAITLSGGEALLQNEAALEILRICKSRGIHTAVETSGLLDNMYYSNTAPLVDTWLFGTRIVTDDSRVFYLDKLLSVIRIIRRYGEIIPRIPMVPGIMDDDETLEQILTILQNVGSRKIWLNPWNRSYDVYYKAIGVKPPFPKPDSAAITMCETKMKAFFAANGYTNCQTPCQVTL